MADQEDTLVALMRALGPRCANMNVEQLEHLRDFADELDATRPKPLLEGWEWAEDGDGATHADDERHVWIEDGELHMMPADGVNKDPHAPLAVIRAVLDRYGREG
jgi:hypothetical protein